VVRAACGVGSSAYDVDLIVCIARHGGGGRRAGQRAGSDLDAFAPAEPTPAQRSLTCSPSS
jgi:hypothetical protein